MLQLLVDNPVLVLGIIAAIGYVIGRISVGGTSLGVAAVLFVGLAVGALDPRLKLPDIVYQLGLVIFVYRPRTVTTLHPIGAGRGRGALTAFQARMR